MVEQMIIEKTGEEIVREELERKVQEMNTDMENLSNMIIMISMI
jgi:hypothetical protein